MRLRYVLFSFSFPALNFNGMVMSRWVSGLFDRFHGMLA